MGPACSQQNDRCYLSFSPTLLSLSAKNSVSSPFPTFHTFYLYFSSSFAPLISSSFLSSNSLISLILFLSSFLSFPYLSFSHVLFYSVHLFSRLLRPCNSILTSPPPPFLTPLTPTPSPCSCPATRSENIYNTFPHTVLCFLLTVRILIHIFHAPPPFLSARELCRREIAKGTPSPARCKACSTPTSTEDKSSSGSCLSGRKT